jgi:peroxiredoxin
MEMKLRRKRSNQSQVLALALIGGGLLLLGTAALVLLPRPDTNAGTEALGLVIPAEVNFPAPHLELTDLQGAPVSLADFSGQVVLLNNWATWCPPCKAEMPTLQAYYEDYQAQGFTIVAIEAGEPRAEVADFVRSYGLTFPVWPDPTQMALSAFRNDALPSTYVIDRDGAIRLTWNGAITRQALEKYVTPLLEN